MDAGVMDLGSAKFAVEEIVFELSPVSWRLME
jgi:hypothetical protein